MFHRTPFFLPWLYPTLTWRIPTSAKELFLTFDDGPVPGPTEFVLDTLKRFDTRATFFCIGDNIEKHEGIYKKITSDGHRIGNHTFNHISGWNHKTSAYVDNVTNCDQVIQHSDNKKANGKILFRPPYGRITRAQIKSLSKYEIIMWDVLTYDYSNRISSENCLKNSINATRPGSIIVFHDSVKAEKNMEYALPRFIEHFINQGYTFKSLPE